jgi:DNA repair exonuclease SbcCD ATPase subunit
MADEVIQKRLKIIADLEHELSKLKGDLEDALMDDPNYGKLLEEEEETKKAKKEKKDRIMSTAVIKGYQEELKEKLQELKETREILSQELVDYYKENGTLEVVDADGNVKRMKFSVKLVS